MQSLLIEDENLKDKLLINEYAIRFINSYNQRFSSIYDKTFSLISKNYNNTEKINIIRRNAIDHINTTVHNIYGDDVVYESKFGTMLVDEIKNNADLFIHKLNSICCSKPSMIDTIIPHEPYVSEVHQITLNPKNNEILTTEIKDIGHARQRTLENEQNLHIDDGLNLSIERHLSDKNHTEDDFLHGHEHMQQHFDGRLRTIDDKVNDTDEIRLLHATNDFVDEQIHLDDVTDNLSYDESFMVGMQKGFIEHATNMHPKTMKKITNLEKVEDKDLEKMLKSYIKSNKHITTQIQKYNKSRASQEETLNKLYDETYGSKYKRKKDTTIFENPHYEKWYKCNLSKLNIRSSVTLVGGRENVGKQFLKTTNDKINKNKTYFNKTRNTTTRNKTRNYFNKTRSNHKQNYTYTESIQRPMFESDFFLGTNKLIESMHMFETDMYKNTYEWDDNVSNNPNTFMSGGVGSGHGILDRNTFQKDYEIIRLLCDMKHDFKDYFWVAWNGIIKRFPRGGAYYQKYLLSEVQFMAMVVNNDSGNIYKHLYVSDATRDSQLDEDQGAMIQRREKFKKTNLQPIEYVVCDMGLGSEYHVDSINLTDGHFQDGCQRTAQKSPEQAEPLIRKYTYGNHLDPSPVTGSVDINFLYGPQDNDVDKRNLKRLNTIIHDFFEKLMDFYENVSDTKFTQTLRESLIPKIRALSMSSNKCGYVYDFNLEENNRNYRGNLSGTDFEINAIRNLSLIEKLPEYLSNILKTLNNETFVRFYLMTFKELGDHIQLHELMSLRNEFKDQDAVINKTIFATRDKILIADAFKQEEPVLFWCDSIQGKFDPGMTLSSMINIDDIKLGGFSSYLFYYSKYHKKFDVDFGNPEYMYNCMIQKFNRYRKYANDMRQQLRASINDVLNPILVITPEAYITDQFRNEFLTKIELYTFYFDQLFEIIKLLYNVEDSDDDKMLHILDKIKPFEEFRSEPGSVYDQEFDREFNKITNQIMSCIYLIDVSFDTIRQYNMVIDDKKIFDNNLNNLSISTETQVKNLLERRLGRSAIVQIDDTLNKLKRLQTALYAVPKTYTTFKSNIRNIGIDTFAAFFLMDGVDNNTQSFNMVKNLFDALIKINGNIDDQKSNLDPTELLGIVDKKIKKITNDLMNKQEVYKRYLEDPFLNSN